MTPAPSEIEQELAAIKALVEALTPLSDGARQRAVDYALRTLDIHVASRRTAVTALPPEPERPSVSSSDDSAPADIRTLTEQKRPRSAIEMAALIAYYLAELAPESERKASVTTEDLQKYFKQAHFKLPGAIQYTLGNAAAAGFFESAGRGEYRLTSVGHNLVAHGLPASDEPAPRARRQPRKAKKSPVKKTSVKKSGKKTAAAQRSTSVPRKAAAKKR